MQINLISLVKFAFLEEDAEEAVGQKFFQEQVIFMLGIPTVLKEKSLQNF